jgi:serine/threonine protein phosphatase PrpC
LNPLAEYWDSAGSTDVGLVRQLNEDSYLDRTDLGLWVVADGMGGHACGDVASQTLCAALDKLPSIENLSSVVDFIDDSVIGVNRELLALARANEVGSVIGCTVVALVARGDHAVCLWAGDSRLYRLRDGILARLSDDHSLVEESPAGLYEPDSKYANVITRAVGADEQLFLDVDAYKLMKGDRFLLCSDGLDKELSDDEIAGFLLSGSPQASSRALVDAALRAGGTDNVTVIVADYRPDTIAERNAAIIR